MKRNLLLFEIMYFVRLSKNLSYRYTYEKKNKGVI